MSLKIMYWVKNKLKVRYVCIELTFLDLIYEEILLYHFEDFKANYELKKLNGDSLIQPIL